MLDNQNFGEQGVSAAQLLENQPEFSQPSRKDRKYIADEVDEYVGVIRTALSQEYEERKIAQDALNTTKKKLDASETKVNDLTLILQSNGQYDPSSLNRDLIPFDENNGSQGSVSDAVDAEGWSAGLSSEMSHEQALEKRIKELEEENNTLSLRLAKAEGRSKVFGSREQGMDEGPVDEPTDLFEDEAWNDEQEDVNIPKSDPIPAPTAPVTPPPPVQQEQQYAETQKNASGYRYVDEQTGQVNLSDTEKSSLILSEAASIAERHISSAQDSAQKIVTDAEQQAQKFVSEERGRMEEAEANLERANNRLREIARVHADEAQALQQFLNSSQSKSDEVSHFVKEDTQPSVEAVEDRQHEDTVVKPSDDWNHTGDRVQHNRGNGPPLDEFYSGA